MHGNKGTQADDGVEESIPMDCRSADENTHWGSNVFSLSPFLPRTGLTARKTGQHSLDVAVDGFIPVRPANNNH